MQRYRCKTITFSGAESASYERNFILDKVTARRACSLRLQFEVFAREQTNEHQDLQSVRHRSMDFLFGRAPCNNIMSVPLDPGVKECIWNNEIDALQLTVRQAEASLGHGGLIGLACFLDSIVTMRLPAHGYGLPYASRTCSQSVPGWYSWRLFHTPP